MATPRVLLRASGSASRATATSSTPALARPFSRVAAQSSSHQKAPALSDIEPEQGYKFDAKQKSFRENLAAEYRKRKEAESASALRLANAAKSSTSTSHDHGSEGGLGSLSTATGEAAKRKDDAENNKKKVGSGRLSSLIYGTEEGREMDREIERSFSQVLARGKYVHSIVFHEVKPDKVDEYVKLVGGWYPKVAKDPENHVNLVGSWRTEVGECDTFGE